MSLNSHVKDSSLYNNVKEPGSVFMTHHILRNLPIGPMSYSVSYLQAFSAQCYVPLQLIGPDSQVTKKMQCCEYGPSGSGNKTPITRLTKKILKSNVRNLILSFEFTKTIIMTNKPVQPYQSCLTVIMFKNQGPYSLYFIFFVTYKLDQYVRVLVIGKPFQPSVKYHSSLWAWTCNIHNTTFSL